MNLTQLRALDALARKRNLTRAAESIGISQPAISHQIKKLQEDYGVKIFWRTGRSMEMTEMGRELVVKARKVLGLLQDMEHTLKAASDLRTGYLSIGLSCHHYVMGILAAFMQRYPGIQVKARIGDSMDLMEQVLCCSIDIAGVTAACPDPRLFNHPFSCQQMVLFVGREHAWASEPQIRAEQLHEERMVTWHAASMTRTLFIERLSALGIRPRIMLELDSWETIRAAVAAGLGFGIALEDECTPDPRICKIGLSGIDVSARQFFVCMPEFRSLRPVQAFFQLADEIGEVALKEKRPDRAGQDATAAAS